MGSNVETLSTREQREARGARLVPFLVLAVCALPRPVVAQEAEAEAEAVVWRLPVADDWAPPLLSGGRGPEGREQTHRFRETFVALADARWPESELGRRAARDAFLEPYGIPPTLRLLRERLRARMERPCAHPQGLLDRFRGSGVDEDDRRDVVRATDAQIEAALLAARQVTRARPLSLRERRAVEDGRQEHDWREGLAAVRARLVCEGHLPEPAPTSPVLDAETRRALERFERQHRIYRRGSLSGETLRALRIEAAELARRDVVRVLATRLSLELGLLGDATGHGGDLDAQLEAHLSAALGLRDPATTLAWLDEVADEEAVEIAAMPLPAWWSDMTDLRVEIDRGDVWTEPPFDAQGERIRFPVERGPTLSVLVRVGDADLEIVRWPTTIGGWHLEAVRGGEEWRYKESPAGTFVWQQIVSAPVWLPPASTPARDLVSEVVAEEGELPRTVLNPTLLGPGHASAYGLAAAYHLPARRGANDQWIVGRDEGIRTHGSVDYTSVWRRASHGCHRLQNHRALALFSFVLAKRAHQRAGHTRVDFRRRVPVGEETQELRIDHGGYVFRLARPVEVRVLPGRVRR